MIPIKKKTEPKQLTEYRCQPFSTYDNIPKDVKQAVREQLLQEQGHLCAYCMRRISDNSNNSNQARIEHWQPQSCSPEKSLDYKNMLAVCSGNETDGRKASTCDVHRGNSPLSVNPCDSDTLKTIKYRSSGTIYSDNDEVNKDLNETLNLNSIQALLPNNRKAALDTLIDDVKKNCDMTNIVSFCKRRLNALQNQTSKKTEYSGILIWWLKKRIDRE